MKRKIQMILRGERPLIDVWHYIVGNLRYKLFYYRFKNRSFFSIRKNTLEQDRHPLMRRHIWEQINFRIKWMNPVCYEQGSCVKCGCETTHLQMANKKCDGDCYPPMMNRKQWEKFKKNRQYSEDKKGNRVWMMNRMTGKPDLFLWDSKNKCYTQKEFYVYQH